MLVQLINKLLMYSVGKRVRAISNVTQTVNFPTCNDQKHRDVHFPSFNSKSHSASELPVPELDTN